MSHYEGTFLSQQTLTNKVGVNGELCYDDGAYGVRLESPILDVRGHCSIFPLAVNPCVAVIPTDLDNPTVTIVGSTPFDDVKVQVNGALVILPTRRQIPLTLCIDVDLTGVMELVLGSPTNKTTHVRFESLHKNWWFEVMVAKPQIALLFCGLERDPNHLFPQRTREMLMVEHGSDQDTCLRHPGFVSGPYGDGKLPVLSADILGKMEHSAPCEGLPPAKIRVYQYHACGDFASEIRVPMTVSTMEEGVTLIDLNGMSRDAMNDGEVRHLIVESKYEGRPCFDATFEFYVARPTLCI